MRLVIPFEAFEEEDRSISGGKAWSLSLLAKTGFDIPEGAVLSVEAYRAYVDSTGIGERIMLEINRKPFESMRWEEMWDAALRIRSLFLKTPIPGDLYEEIAPMIENIFGEDAVAVRSSAPGEDSGEASFAGLHESFLNIKGKENILEHIRLVWASLWSDAALLYRRELGLDVSRSSMAVVIQKLAAGDRSGVVFSRSPMDSTATIVEAVWGLNQGLVDGTVSPDRWIIDRKTGKTRDHAPAERENAVRTSPDGTRLEPLPEEIRLQKPLDDNEVKRVYRLAMKAEERFGSPQDVEWTFSGQHLFALQSRPVTTGGQDDSRSWNLSLRRSFENLRILRKKIEGELIPSLIREAEKLADQDIHSQRDEVLAKTLRERESAFERWTGVYWEYFIPFAHGTRLFGQIYNDRIKPEDPFSFVDLLRPEHMAGTDRNKRIESFAERLRNDPALRKSLQEFSRDPKDLDARELVRDALSVLGADSSIMLPGGENEQAMAAFLLELSQNTYVRSDHGKTAQKLANEFLDQFTGREKDSAKDLLDLARASYRLRDEDNIYLGRIERLRDEALAEGLKRLGGKNEDLSLEYSAAEVAKALEDPLYSPVFLKKTETEGKTGNQFSVSARQLVGQPAGHGLARGVAHVIETRKDLFSFKSGEILVCDAIDPNMTFVVPMASAIVERRGGMLIHGAIIAREYGLACVTGIPEATRLIKNGDTITVDGYLGIVTIHENGG